MSTMKENSNNMKVDSPEYNKKTKKSFIILMIVCLCIGGLAGFFGAMATDLLKGDITNISEILTKKYPFFQSYVMPWIILAFTVVCYILGEIWIKKGKKQIATWDGEDDEHISVAGSFLDKVSTLSSVLIIVIQILFGLATYQLMTLFDTVDNIYMTAIAIVAYFAAITISIRQSNKVVKLTKEFAPEKKGSVYDRKFHKVWYESCDEAERQKIGEASYKTMRFMISTFSTLLPITAIVGMFLPIGLLCAFFIGILWLIMTCYYSHACTELEHGN